MFEPATIKLLVPSASFVSEPDSAVETMFDHFLLEVPIENVFEVPGSNEPVTAIRPREPERLPTNAMNKTPYSEVIYS